LIREFLWDWFVDIRRSVATTISPKFMLFKAREIAGMIVNEQRKIGAFEPLPVLDRHWLQRFKRDKGIVFRKPNLRYKCSKVVLLRRLRAMWLNVFRVRRLAEHFLKTDLSEVFYGIDEKPLHFNESGSKAVRTLEIVGAPAVRLKENHAATRERVSLMTTVTSSPTDASAGSLPIELLFKARSNRRIQFLKSPTDLSLSFQWAIKGSYRQEHILKFLKRWLRPWTPAREASADYRVLMMDLAASHVSDEVVDAAWSAGYVTLYHYGCTTGVAQVNDTDCHGALEQVYLELEQASFNHQQLYEPGSVVRRPQDVVDDVCGTWRALAHQQGCLGHLRNGITGRLDGSQDNLIHREALAMWRELDMPSLRRAALAEVDAKVHDGSLASFAEWRQVVEHPSEPGAVEDEGAEFEGELAAGEAVYLDAALSDDDADFELESNLAPLPVVPVEPPASDPVACQAAVRLNRLRRLRADAVAASVPAAFFTIDREVLQLERGFRSGAKDVTANLALRRAVEEASAKEALALRAKRLESFKERRAKQLVASAKAKAKAAVLAEKKEKNEREARLAALPKTFTIDDVGATTPAGHTARVNCMERLHLLSPKLPFAEEARWKSVRDGYCLYLARCWGPRVGKVFLDQINDVLAELKEHYTGKTSFNNKGQTGGFDQAFFQFFQFMEAKIPKPTSLVSL